jgi:hypothetical protein
MVDVDKQDVEKRIWKSEEAFCKLKNIWGSNSIHLQNENKNLSCFREGMAAVFLRVVVCDWSHHKETTRFR